jgi:hypothetical protein
MSKINQQNGFTWAHWYLELQKLASKHRVSVADEDAWTEDWEAGKTPEASFFGEYPEAKPAEACVHKQHNRPCGQCPWRRDSLEGWLGASEPGEFLAQSDSGLRMPCHSTVDYEAANWKAAVKTAPQCAGHAIFLSNRCKSAAPGVLKLPADKEAVFSWPHEFIEHHTGREPGSLLGTQVYELYEMTSRRTTAEAIIAKRNPKPKTAPTVE